jgi:hypothetical protein
VVKTSVKKGETSKNLFALMAMTAAMLTQSPIDSDSHLNMSMPLSSNDNDNDNDTRRDDDDDDDDGPVTHFPNQPVQVDDLAVLFLPHLSFSASFDPNLRSLSPDPNCQDCAICLGSFDDQSLMVQLTACSHPFCRDCISQYIRLQAPRTFSAIICPSCKTRIDAFDVREFGGEEAFAIAHMGLASETSNATPPDDASPEAIQAHQQFIHLAEQMHLRMCPHCSAVIEKNGGCDNVVCRCGIHFRWSEAKSFVPCSKVCE